MARAFDFRFFAWDAVVKMTGLLMLQFASFVLELFESLFDVSRHG